MISSQIWLKASIEQLEALSIEDLQEIRLSTQSADDIGACGPCRYGLEDRCECGDYQVTSEQIDDIINYKLNR